MDYRLQESLRDLAIFFVPFLILLIVLVWSIAISFRRMAKALEKLASPEVKEEK